MKILTFFLILNLTVFSQKKTDSLALFNEFFIAGNQIIFKDSQSKTGYGKYGFDFGAKRILRKERPINFVYGLEFSFNQYYLNYLNPQLSSYYTIYKNSLVSNFLISNSFNTRINLGKSKRTFLESGLFIDFNLLRHVKGTYIKPDTTRQINESFAALPFKIGFNFGFGYNLFLKKITIGIKPDIKFNLLPYFLNYEYDYFERFAYSRLVLSFKLIDSE